jgi:hypothetical protein
MATIKPELMEAILGQRNWEMASRVADRVFVPGELFRPPKAPPPPALVVPVDVQALYHPAGHGETYVHLPMELGGPAGAEDPVPPFSAPRDRPAGVHLHWALPDGLLRGELEDRADAPLKMRALPNRWLVLRLLGPRNARRLAVRGWVIESERGRVFDLAGYPGGAASGDGDEIAPAALDGVVGGSPNWTAGYDATRNRFAFHDPLGDVDPGQITTRLATYVVIGWWSERGHDPLSGALSPFSVARRLPQFGWTASAAPLVAETGPALFDRVPFREFGIRGTAAAARPQATATMQVDIAGQLKLGTAQKALAAGFSEYVLDTVAVSRFRAVYDTLLHGVVYGVPISGRVSGDSAPRAAAIEVSMAPTLERLLAAQAAKGLNVTAATRKEYLESLLTAVANGSIMRLGDRDGTILLDEAEHADGFEAFQGPETYEDVIVERGQTGLTAGRQPRTKRAAEATGAPVAAEIIWNGRKRGSTKATLLQMRQTAADKALKAAAGSLAADDRPQVRRIRRPGPRYHRAVPPVVGLRNYGRSHRFNDDGRFDDSGRLLCRWTSELATGFGEVFETELYLPRLQNAAIPGQAERILQNSFLYDPYMLTWAFQAIQTVLPAATAGAVQNRLRGEIALRYSPDGTYDGMASVVHGAAEAPFAMKTLLSEELRRFSIIEGRDPSPVAVTCWRQPWSPVWLEWEVALEPGDGLRGWVLGRIDFGGESVPTGASVTIRGRSPITTGLARTYQAVIQSYLIAEAQRDEAGAGEIAQGHEARLAELAEFLGGVDLGSVTLDAASDVWLAIGTGPDGHVLPVPETVAQAFADAGLPRLVASGRLRLAQARVIDSFGRFRDLDVTRVTLPAALETKDAQGRPAMRLPPRLAVPARLMWRFVDPAEAGANPGEATLDQERPERTKSPIAGYLLPDFIDESIEFFDAGGAPLGEVLHDPVTGGLIWEGGVGREGPAVTLPEEGLSPAARLCGRIAQGMIDADIAQRADPETEGLESPLSAFLRAVDTTMWGIEGLTGAASGATLAGLVGRPVAITSTTLWIDIPQDLARTGAYGETADALRDFLIAQGVHEAIKAQGFDVRLGDVARGQDGLYGYFLGDDFSRFNLISTEIGGAARLNRIGRGYRAILGGVGAEIGSSFLPAPSPIDCPYITRSLPLSLHPGHKVRVTLLMHPSARVHATTGFLPRKSLELLRDWVAPGLARIAPSARVGPVLIDPDKVRLPKVAAFGANQTWTRRDSPITWRNDPILSATQAALLPEGRVTVEEGYIRITPDPEAGGSGGGT